jgi:hypothetical protein
MLILTEDLDYNNAIFAAVELIEFVIAKYKIKTFNEFTCPYMKALAKELYVERFATVEPMCCKHPPDGIGCAGTSTKE